MESKNENKEQKPTENQEQLDIKVVGNDGTELYFKIKKETPLKKLFDAYCARQGYNPNSIRFSFDGNRIDQNHTASKIGLETGDIIDAMVEQTGGNRKIK